MRNEFLIGLVATLISLPGCSSLSMPSVPGFKSAAPADPTAEALFAEGNRNFNEKRYARAIVALQKIKTDHPFSPLLTETELKIADAYYLNQQYPEAIAAFKEFQGLHPTNENIPFVTLRLGQAHLDQFTSTERDQKNTELAKGYFETVITNYPKSPHAVTAAENLAKCVQHLSEHEFNVAHFYYQQEKYPAARDRFEEIVRKYKSTPTAIKSLYYLGESYKKEKNWVKASLAYEAIIQYYPETKFAADAKTQLAQLDKEKQDPLALLLMRDRRPSAVAAPEVKEEPALSKLKDLNLVAKKDYQREEPGDEKGIFRRVADKLNPFSSSDSGKKEEKPETATELLARRKEAEKKDSGGMFASLWPFSRQTSNETNKPSQTGVVNQVDESLKQKGVSPAQQATLKPPAADLPKNDDTPVQTMDSGKLVGAIDSNLNKSGKNPGELPPIPEAAAVFKEPAPAVNATAKTTTQAQPPPSLSDSGLLGSIDQKLKSQGVQPENFETPSLPTQGNEASAKKSASTKIELEPKLNVEKGPLFLAPEEVPNQTTSSSDTIPEAPQTQQQPSASEAQRNLVRGPAQPQASTKPPEPRKRAAGEEVESKGLLESISDDIDGLSKMLNPFRW